MTQTILVVDDDLDFAEAVSYYLEQQGFRVLKAENGREGLKLAKMERPDLILMDIMMDERTEGLFVLQELRHSPLLANVPIFVLSALYSQRPDFGVAPARGWMAHDEFFAKPVNLEKLIERIRARLAASPPPIAPKEAAL